MPFDFGVGVVIPLSWRDFQGAVRFSLLSGTMNLDSMVVRIFDDGSKYSQTVPLPVTAIPEPEIYAMMGLGLGLLGWVGRRRKLAA